MNRLYDMQEAAKNNIYIHYGGFDCGVQDRCFDSFIDGAKWADEHVSNEVYEKVSNIIVDNAPDLEWVGEEYGELISYGFQGRYIIDRRNFLYFDTNMCCIASGYDFSKKCNSLDEAKQAANEDYKNRIKKALGVCE